MKTNQYFLLFIVYISVNAASEVLGPKNCSIDNVNTAACDENETCSEINKSSKIGVCKCKADYERSKFNQTCMYVTPPPTTLKPVTDANKIVPIDEDATDKSAVLSVSLIVILLAFGFVFGVYFGEKKFGLVTRLRIRLSRNNTYDEVLIGQDDDDDPPIA